jgi:hypothetical protein
MAAWLPALQGLRQLPVDVAAALANKCEVLAGCATAMCAEYAAAADTASGSRDSSSSSSNGTKAQAGAKSEAAEGSKQSEATAAAAAAGGMPPSKALQLRTAAASLQQLAAAVSAQFPVGWCCNNPDCANLTGLSGRDLVSGSSSKYRCSGCHIASYCSRDCQVRAWLGLYAIMLSQTAEQMHCRYS